MYDEAGKKLSGVEAVIDKDLCSSLLAQELVADILIIATDVDAAYVDWASRPRRPSPRPTRTNWSASASPPAPWVRRSRPPSSSPAPPARTR